MLDNSMFSLTLDPKKVAIQLEKSPGPLPSFPLPLAKKPGPVGPVAPGGVFVGETIRLGQKRSIKYGKICKNHHWLVV